MNVTELRTERREAKKKCGQIKKVVAELMLYFPDNAECKNAIESLTRELSILKVQRKAMLETINIIEA